MFGYDTVRFCRNRQTQGTFTDDRQGLGGGLIALPSFAKRFGLDQYDPKSKELADLKGNIVSILQGGW